MTAQQSLFMQAPPLPSSLNPHQLKSSFPHTDILTVRKSLSTGCPPLKLQDHLPDSHHFATQFGLQHHSSPSQSKSHHQFLPHKQAALKPSPTSTQLTARHQIPQVSFPPLSPPTPRTGSFLALTHWPWLPENSQPRSLNILSALPSSPSPFHR